ncbi:MAG: enoyl-CoA hydratase/isomerase family protein [Streptosporangiales bacterium]|nr:enoyl-CoA hydratase/isomerase family protein [Streptosporangiales bacterium]
MTSSDGLSENGLRVEVADRVAYATLDRPERLNALGTGLQRHLVEAFDAIASDDSVWVVHLTGAGDRAFCAGVDLKEIRENDAAGRRGVRRPMTGLYRNVFEAIVECPKPTVAVLNGWAMGGGLELALACDLRVASEAARMGLPESKRGMGANFGAQMLARVVPLGVAYDLLYTGRDVSAAEALAMGLVNRVWAAGEFRERAREFTLELAARAPLTLRRYKSVISRGVDLPLSAALRLDPKHDPYDSADRAEGVAAFLEKRPPNWQAR